MIAIITNKQAAPNLNGSHVCTVTCPDCGHAVRVSFGGWCALRCGGCKGTVHRNRASKRSNERQGVA